MDQPAQEALEASHSMVLSFVQLLSGLLVWIVTLISYRIPRFTLQVLSWTGVITLEFNLVKVLIIFGVLTSIFSLWIKVAYLNRYTKLKEPPLPKDPGFELHPQLAAGEQGQSLGSYLDEFLSAIRVFGFLEKPVFHELARHLQTRRLIAGDTLSLDSDNSFYIVIDGTCQVYVPGHDATEASLAADEDGQGPLGNFQLLNEVTNGGTLSSLFTILSLFTDNVRLRYEEDERECAEESQPEPVSAPSSERPHLKRDISFLSLSASGRHRAGSLSSARGLQPPAARNGSRGGSPNEGTPPSPSPAASRRSSSTHHHHQTDQEQDGPAKSSSHSRRHGREHEPIIARAKSDTTLAVIPAEAFQRVTQKFPNASAHIIQVILSRLARVTLVTGHKYLGLTKEILTTEKAINEMACYPLPEEFYASGGMQRLRRRFVPDTVDPEEEPSTPGYFTFDPPSPIYGPSMGETIRRNSSAGTEAVRLRWQPQTPYERTRRTSKASVISSEGLTARGESPSMGPPRSSTSVKSPRQREPSIPTPAESRSFSLHEQDHFDLRASVMDCIAKSMGLAQPTTNVPLSSPAPSAPESPGFLPHDSRPFGSSFGSLSALAQRIDDNASASTVSNMKPSTPELENEVEILFFTRGSTLVKDGQSNAGVFYVIDGFLDVLLPPDEKSDSSASTPLFSVKPGGIAGYLASLTGSHSYVDIKAKTDVYVGYLSSKALERMMDRKPIVLLTLAKRLISLLSPLMLHIDLALEWMQVSSGQVIYNEGDSSDSIYMCIQGRLRGINERSDGSVEVKSEFGQGDSVGELECLTSSPRPWTLHAIRDTELVRMPAQLFNAIAMRHPSITVHMTQLLASRIHSEIQSKSMPTQMGSGKAGNANLKTVAILPVTHHIPVSLFAGKLRSALETMGASTTYLNHATVMGVMGRHAFTRMGKLKLAAWLADAEQHSRIVLYVADSQVSSPWTQTCIRQADCIMLVAFGAGDPGLGEYERLMVSMKTTARKELVLLHPERLVAAGSTRPFLQARPWVHTHHHIEMSGAPAHSATSNAMGDAAAVAALRKVQRGIQERIGKFYNISSKGSSQPTRGYEFDDYSRLSRWLCNKSVGVVLGGGGARGISHVGALRALRDKGIPIDMVGGTSIGSFIGGLYAREADLWTTQGRAKKFSGRMSTLWRIITDLTYPITAYTTGHEFNRGIYKSFYHLHIEDFWLPYFAVTTNITWSRMETHTSGFAWRYIRASMSLAGLLPPMCDDGHMLLDGGYFDNLPVSSMFSRGAEKVFAVDVGSIDDNSPRNFPDTVSGCGKPVRLKDDFQWSTARSVPSLTEIQSRLTYVSSVKTLEEAKKTPGVFYMRQPVTEFGTMDFGKFDEISEVGYKYAQSYLSEEASKGTLPTGLIEEGASSGSRASRRQRSNNAAYTTAAQRAQLNGAVMPRTSSSATGQARTSNGVRMRRASI